MALRVKAGRTPALMLQGTGSDVGKSLLVAGLARAFTAQGLRVRPFKPQNMSNNAAVTEDGGEIGRAQALQARACGVAASIHMNPVLLKPQSATGSQIVVQGRVFGQALARDYHSLKPTLLPRVLDSFAILEAQADLVIVEGAGSPAEINLRAGDIANMGFAEAADVPVVLVGDIDRGGVIASLVGTCEILAERARLKGFIVNKLRGDPTLFAAGERFIAERTGLPCLGTVPFFPDAARLPAEDSVALDRQPTPTPTLPRPAGEGVRSRSRAPSPGKAGEGRGGGGLAAFRIAIPRLPHIANFDDLDPLAAEPGIIIDMVNPGRPLPYDAGLILLPGSKATRADLAALRAEGWDIDILAHHRQGRPVLGLCGGYQMLGRSVADPDGIEGPAGTSPGLGLLPVDTVLGDDKRLEPVDAVDGRSGQPIQGYEMHLGRTSGEAPCFLSLAGRPEGAMSANGLVQGSYIHGLFSSDAYRRWYLARLGVVADPALAFEAGIERTLDALAEHLGRHLDLAALLTIARGR